MSNLDLFVADYSSPDIDIESWSPVPTEPVYFLLEFSVGVRGDPASDVFYVIVATPEGLRSRSVGGELVISARGTIVVSDYSWSATRSAVEAIIRDCASPTWVESVMKLQRFFHWEYEDYQLVESDEPG